MAFDNQELALVSSVNGFGLYRYDTLDAHATVDGDGYFNKSDDSITWYLLMSQVLLM